MVDFTVTDRLVGAYQRCAEPTHKLKQSIGYLNAEVSSELVLIRLLIGSGSIEYLDSGQKWHALVDYSTLGCKTSVCTAKADIDTFLENTHSVDPVALDVYLRKGLKHDKFYEELVGELLHYLWRRERGEHTLSFLHVYRFLERISFAFPMLYSARSSDFKAAYTAVQQYFVGGADKGELAFFKRFVEISIEEQLRDAKVKFDVSALPASSQARVFKILRRFVNINDIESEQSDVYFEVKYQVILGLLINLRNRFFHFTSSHESNISAVELGDSDLMFSVIAPACMNWLSVIYFEILQQQIE